MNYYERRWDETRGDEQDHWGKSMWYFEIGDNDYPTKQAEVYENGLILRYDDTYSEDEYGGLSAVSLDTENITAL